ncbi:MAG: CDGSH iron-sulfur domain-containing protein [Bacteroidaceae bacterium]|nr:CDGSH iron-sulfur domain-containing protein [Bacteroidaceae bacterium]
MMQKSDLHIESGSIAAPETFYIKVTADGPYLLFGNPPIDEEIIVFNDNGDSWLYKRGKHFNSEKSPVALCRCGSSKNKPYCDGSHRHCHWDSKETASHKPLLDEAYIYEGPTMILADNEVYCAFARFCDAYGTIWNLVQKAETDIERELVKHEAGHCPAGRLIVWDKKTGKPYEPHFEPSVGIIEDSGLKVHGPLWVKGGIRIEGADGRSYEVRNRVTLCRCGASFNKPFCDGTHANVAAWPE